MEKEDQSELNFKISFEEIKLFGLVDEGDEMKKLLEVKRLRVESSRNTNDKVNKRSIFLYKIRL